MDKDRTLPLILFLTKTQGKQCPQDYFFPINETELLDLADKNKTIPFLFNLATFPQCQNKLKQETLRKISHFEKCNLIQKLLFEKETVKFSEFCQEHGIKAVLLKDFSSYPKIKYHQQYQMGGDIDILIQITNLRKIKNYLNSQGYTLKKNLKLKDSQKGTYYQEYDFTHPLKHTSFDIHTQIAIPHRDEFTFLSRKKIVRITNSIFQNSKSNKQNHLYSPTPEYFIFSLIVHYLGSDILTGLRNLLDIAQFAYIYDSSINWSEFLRIAKNFKLKNLSLYTLLLGDQIFDLPLSKQI